MSETWVDKQGHLKQAEVHQTRKEFFEGRIMYCTEEKVHTTFYPELGRAKCKTCGYEFDFYPPYVNTTKGMDPVPRCPHCHDYRNTIYVEGHTRRYHATAQSGTVSTRYSRDITNAVEIVDNHVKALAPFNGTIRVSMRYQGQTIGVLRSTGWNMLKGYELQYVKHPTTPNDDSWFRVIKEP